jgi:hypothetical protein
VAAWNNWYHVNGNTYGTWLPGDPRGWRERGHKKHVVGDYKKPPPAGSGDAMHHHAKELLNHPPVHLDNAQRLIAGRALVEMLLKQKIEVLIVALDAIHFHLLSRFPSSQVRPIVGRAKKHAYFELHDCRFVGHLWGTGTNIVPIEDRKHQVNVYNYIADHKTKGAWAWTFREGIYWREERGESSKA